MASLDYYLNPLFSIKECSSYGALYTRNCGCSKGSLEDKILVPVPDSSQRPPHNCTTCGDPVDGLYYRPCAFVRRKCLNEGWSTIHDENEILNTYESSNDNTNVSCGNGAHIGYNCPPKALIISNPEQCNQTIDELPQTLPSVHLTCNSEKENSLPYVSKPNFVDDSPNDFNPPPQPPIVCDVPLCNNPTPLEAFKEHSETIIDSNNDYSSSGDDSYENIDYVDASPPDAEIVSLDVVEIVIPEVGGIDDDILLTMKDDILREKYVNVKLPILVFSNIEALKDNLVPSFDVCDQVLPSIIS
ncbi:hypothetical protein Tco_1563673 [Tanacetum coccineum]